MTPSIRRTKKHLFLNCLLLLVGVAFAVNSAVYAHLHYAKVVHARDFSHEVTMNILLNGIPKAQPWKIYENKEFNFSIKYPFDWKVSVRDDSQIHFYPASMPFATDNDGQGVVVIFLYSQNSEDMVPDQYSKKEPLSIAGLTATRYDGIPGGFNSETTYTITDTIIEHSEGAIGITYFNNRETKSDDDHLLTYQAMVNSFKLAP